MRLYFWGCTLGGSRLTSHIVFRSCWWCREIRRIATGTRNILFISVYLTSWYGKNLSYMVLKTIQQSWWLRMSLVRTRAGGFFQGTMLPKVHQVGVSMRVYTRTITIITCFVRDTFYLQIIYWYWLFLGGRPKHTHPNNTVGYDQFTYIQAPVQGPCFGSGQISKTEHLPNANSWPQEIPNGQWDNHSIGRFWKSFSMGISWLVTFPMIT